MSTDINQVVLVGRVTKDVATTYTTSGTPVAKFSVACNEAVKQQDESWQDKPSFFDCTLWGKQAETLAQYLTKGRQVAITGRLRQEQWTDQQSGQNRSKVVVNVQSLELLSVPQGEGNQAPQRTQALQDRSYQQNRQQYQSRQQEPSQRDMYDEPSPGPESFEDDIPF
jgi:single-strand DNA-binding protein